MPITKHDRPEKAHSNSGSKVSYEDIAFLLDYLEENRDDLAVLLNKSLRQRNSPRASSARLSKAAVARKVAARFYDLTGKSSRWDSAKNAGATRVLATWRQIHKQYQTVRKTICKPGFRLGSADHTRGIKSIEHSISIAQCPSSELFKNWSDYNSSFADHGVSFADIEEHGQSRQSRSEYVDYDDDDGENVDVKEDEDEIKEDRSRPPPKRSFAATLNRFADVYDRQQVNRTAELVRYKKAKLQLLAYIHALEKRRIAAEIDLAK
ncbi:hypothetical protein BX666DRAFT_2027279 [Dichotomocladium elegans]|nr:hypothetical protein BX666DRAFT_2027279 [Dichotomocladium elegans]